MKINGNFAPPILAIAIDSSALQPITLPVMNSLVSTNKVVVDANIDADMVPEFPSDTQNPLDYIHKQVDSVDSDTTFKDQVVQVNVQHAVLPKIVNGPCYTEPMDCLPELEGRVADSPMESVTSPPTPANGMVEPVSFV
jgi:hypothetical protein